MESELVRTVVIAALAIAAAAALWAGWVLFVAWSYRLRAERPPRLRAVCEDGWELAVYHRAARPRRYAEPVLLCHGLAANHFYFDLDPPHSLAAFLAEAGFECFSIEWRGTGGSRRPPRGRRWSDYCVDDHIRFDGPALIAHALEKAGGEKAFWLGHSLGALVGYAVAQGPAGRSLKGLLALGAPVRFAYDTVVRSALALATIAAWPFGLRYRMLATSIAPLAGMVALPFTDFVINPRNMSPRLQRQAIVQVFSSIGRKILLQLKDWAQNDAFRSFDRQVDYRAGLARVELPAAVIAGSGDRLATPANARAQYEALGSTDKTLIVFGRENGDREEYGHGDLVFGASAPEEVFPAILRWLRERATPL